MLTCYNIFYASSSYSWIMFFCFFVIFFISLNMNMVRCKEIGDSDNSLSVTGSKSYLEADYEIECF